MPRLTDLLVQARHDGYPADFLLARLRSRQARFAASCPVGGPEEAWRELQSEYLWLYNQMDLSLRQQMAPIFLVLELKNLFAALRFIEGQDRSGRNQVLKMSLLAPHLKNILQKETSFAVTLKDLGKYLGLFDPCFAGLEEVFRQQGMAGLEKKLTGSFLVLLDQERANSEVKAFILRLLERRNLVLLAKEHRWKLEDAFYARQEGYSKRQLQRAWRSLASRRAVEEVHPASLENQIVQTLAIDIRRLGRSNRKIPRLIDYVWACYLAARNCGVSGLESLLGKNRVMEETVS